MIFKKGILSGKGEKLHATMCPSYMCVSNALHSSKRSLEDEKVTWQWIIGKFFNSKSKVLRIRKICFEIFFQSSPRNIYFVRDPKSNDQNLVYIFVIYLP